MKKFLLYFYAVLISVAAYGAIDNGVQSWLGSQSKGIAQPVVVTTTTTTTTTQPSDLVLEYLMGANGSESTLTLDTSGNDYTGTVTTAEWTEGTNGLTDYYLFSGADNDKIIKSHEVELNPKDEMTLSVWSRKDGAHQGNFGAMASKWSGTTANRAYSLYEVNDGKVEWKLNSGESTKDPNVNVSGVWRHWVGTYDGAVQYLYLNGDIIASNEFVSGIWTNTDNFRVGIHTDESQLEWNGGLWGVKVHDIALTPEQVTQTKIQQKAQLGIMSQYLADNLTDYTNCVLNVENIFQDGSKEGFDLSTASSPTQMGTPTTGWGGYDGGNNHLNESAGSSLLEVSGQSNMTWYALIRPDSDGEGNSGRIMANSASGGGPGFFHAVFNESASHVDIISRIYYGGDNAEARTTGSIAINEWTHFACVWNEDNNNKLKIYTNGILASLSIDDTGTGGVSDDSSKTFYIGNCDAVLDRAFDGDIKSVGVFVDSLDSATIYSIATNALGQVE